jgi:putative ABC transport system ATP-binding protein
MDFNACALRRPGSRRRSGVVMSECLVRVEHLSKVFHRDSAEVVALNDASLEIATGEFVALMGPSGSGKTTLLNVIAGIDRPSSGHVYVGDIDITDLDEDELAEWRNQHIGFIFQMYNLIPVLTARENVELPLLLTDLSRAERRAHAEAALALVGLQDRLEHRPRQLSGGQEQRVAIARALVTDPVLLLADEPTGDLDAKSAQEVLGILNRLNREFRKTIIMVTHDPKAAKAASVVRHLDKGELLPLEGTP